MQNPTSIHEFSFTTLEGEHLSFEAFKGKKILLVNTASKCGFTPQYASLEMLHKEYGDQLVIVGVPANNFGAQEPGSNIEIAEFCERNYGVSFIMAEKQNVAGTEQTELFRWLTSQPNPDFTGDIQWNFEKFLLDENGKLIRRYRSSVDPLDESITATLK